MIPAMLFYRYLLSDSKWHMGIHFLLKMKNFAYADGVWTTAMLFIAEISVVFTTTFNYRTV